MNGGSNMSKREEFLMENIVDNLDAYGNKIGKCLTDIHFEKYNNVIISDYVDSLVYKDISSLIVDRAKGGLITINDAKEACAMVADKYEKQLECMVSKEDAIKALKQVYDAYCICDSTIGKCGSCLDLEEFEQLLNQINK